MPDTDSSHPLRIGFYICHCGHNIAGTIDVASVAHYAAALPHVSVAREYKYMCSDPGQELIQKDIRDLELNRIVVASCSPLLHEHTFRQAVEKGGLNPFFFQMVNIREDVSWVNDNPAAATVKAKDLARAAIFRVSHHRALDKKHVSIHPDALVVGAGIAGIHAALTLANAGKKVTLVEREPTIGGHMAMFDKTFPTLDCAACILTPKMSAVRNHPNIRLLSYSEVKVVGGYVGNYKVTIRRKPRYIKEELCVGCMECIEACVYKEGKTPTSSTRGSANESRSIFRSRRRHPRWSLSIPQRALNSSRVTARRRAFRYAIGAPWTSRRRRRRSTSMSGRSSLPRATRRSIPSGCPTTDTGNTPTCTVPRSRAPRQRVRANGGRADSPRRPAP